jgi:hypothetical protein
MATTVQQIGSRGAEAAPRNPAAKRPRRAHIFDRDSNDRYVEPAWCSRRLFDVEPFVGPVHDPACGTATILATARAAGLIATGADISPCVKGVTAIDFFTAHDSVCNVISNPPYDRLDRFASHALELTSRKVALLVPIARLNAAGRWLQSTPLRRIWLLSPRPSIPPHSYILRGEKPEGGRVDFCWLVWEQGFRGVSEFRWLHRDGEVRS